MDEIVQYASILFLLILEFKNNRIELFVEVFESRHTVTSHYNLVVALSEIIITRS